MQSTFGFAALRQCGITRTATIALSLAMLIAASATSASVLTKSYSFASDSVMFAKDTIADTVFDVVTMSNCGVDDRLVGAPQLPQRAVQFLIPSNEKLDSVIAAATTVETLAGSYYPIPIQPPHDTSTAFFPPLLYLYEAGYPGDFIDGAGGGNMATYRLASFYLRPARLLPDGRLVKAQQLSVDIYTSPDLAGFGGLTQMRRGEFCQEELLRTVEAIVENPECITYGASVPVVAPQSPLVISPGPSPDNNYVDCVVITLEASAADYERYAEFLTERGIVTTVRTLEWIDANPLYHGADKAASMRAFIKDAYQQWGTLYVMLGGWPTDLSIGLPTRMIRSESDEGVQGWQGWATTDVYFADLEGTWNENGNSIYAEPPLPGMAAFYFTDELHGCGVAPWSSDYQAASAFLTQNGGTDWSFSSSAPSDVAYMNDMYFADDEHGWCVGYRQEQSAEVTLTLIWKTADGGRNWQTYGNTEYPGRLSAVHFINADVGWAVGWATEGSLSGLIFRTTNGGTDWVQVQSPIQARLIDVEFSASGQVGWITANSGVVLRTTDGGASWAVTSVPGTDPCTKYVSFADDNVGWATGRATFGVRGYCAVWATTDGGVSWQDPTQLGNAFFGSDIQAVRTDGNPPSYDVWVATNLNEVFHRDPQGSWTRQWRSGGIAMRHIQFLDANHGWAGGIGTVGYLSTTDGGVTWNVENPELFWGDPSAQDMLPEVFVARLPSKPQDGEAQTIVDKLKTYQVAPPFDHLRKVKLCTGYDLPGHDAMTQEPWYVSHNLETWKLYYPPVGDLRFNRADMLRALNDGFQFMTHQWHGGHNYWMGADGDPSAERIWSSDFDNGTVHNGDMTGIAVTEGCNALYLLGDVSIGRHFLTCPTGGSVAYQGCSRPNIWAGVGPTLIYYNLMRQVYEQSVTRLGTAYVAAVTPKCGAGRGRAYENLLGDPLMDIWTDVPRAFDVTHPLYVPPQEGWFEVTVLDNETHQPVEGALVCLSMYDPTTGVYPVYHRQETDLNGVATFLIEPKATGEIVVTVTKHNCLPHTSTCHVGLLSGDPNATYPNWGRKLAREPNTDNFHVVCTDGDMAFYSQSTDGGETWSAAEPIGNGKYAAIILNPNPAPGGDGLVPWVTYLTPAGSIMRAIRVAPGTWDQAVVFLGSAGNSAGAPSLAPASTTVLEPTAYVAYPVYGGDPPTDNFVYFNSFTSASVSPPVTLDAAGPAYCYGASVAVTAGDIIHVGWIRGQSVIYRERRNAVWSDQAPVSSPVYPITEPASNPSLEAYGDSVFCVWRGPNDNGVFPGDVWRRSRLLTWDPWHWADPTNQSQTPDRESNFPVMTTSFVTVWQERVALEGYPDIWGRFLAEPYPRPFFESPLPSRYPHVDGYWVPSIARFKCNTVWTEMLDQMLPLYEVKFGVRSYVPSLGKGLGPVPHGGYEPSLYYAATLGRPEQSPYCLSREGYAKLGSWDVDTSTTTLKYQLPYLDPRQVYKLCAVIYHEGKKSWSSAVRCDSGVWSQVKAMPGIPDTVWLRLPKRSYKQDARIVFELARLTGDFVSLAELKLFQIEDRSREDEGVQGAATTGMFVTRLRSCSPNPFARTTSIDYELGRSGPVALTVHDVSGRLVRRLECGPRLAGRHVVRWDGADSRGHAVPAGVYFVRLSASGKASTGRLTLVR